MAIFYTPSAGRIVMCDFRGYEKPEMVKVRPVVVISPKYAQRGELVTIVPLSTTPPITAQPYHFEFDNNPIPGRAKRTWAKCDMLATVCLARLDRVKIGRGDYQIPKISRTELNAIRGCVRHFLGL